MPAINALMQNLTTTSCRDELQSPQDVLLVQTDVADCLAACPRIGQMQIPGVPFNLQASEVAKLCLIAYMAGYLERFLPQVRRQWGAFLRPLVVVGVVTVPKSLLTTRE